MRPACSTAADETAARADRFALLGARLRWREQAPCVLANQLRHFRLPHVFRLKSRRVGVWWVRHSNRDTVRLHLLERRASDTLLLQCAAKCASGLERAAECLVLLRRALCSNCFWLRRICFPAHRRPAQIREKSDATGHATRSRFRFVCWVDVGSRRL